MMYLGKSNAFSAGPSTPVALTYLGRDGTNTETTSHDFVSKTLGTGSILVVSYCDNTGTFPASITVDGTSATLVTDGTTTADVGHAGCTAVMYIADGITSATGTINITYGINERVEFDYYLITTGYTIQNVAVVEDFTTGVGTAPYTYAADVNTVADGAVVCGAIEVRSTGLYEDFMDTATGISLDSNPASEGLRIRNGNDVGGAFSVLTTTAETPRSIDIGSSVSTAQRVSVISLALGPA